MNRLIWIFAGHTRLIVGFLRRWLMSSFCTVIHIFFHPFLFPSFLSSTSCTSSLYSISRETTQNDPQGSKKGCVVNPSLAEHDMPCVSNQCRSASVAHLDAPSDWRPGGRGFNPCRGRQHSFVEIDHEIFSTVILFLPLIQEGQLSVSGERMCTILVNRLED